MTKVKSPLQLNLDFTNPTNHGRKIPRPKPVPAILLKKEKPQSLLIPKDNHETIHQYQLILKKMANYIK